MQFFSKSNLVYVLFLQLLDQAFRDGNLNRFLNEKAISKYYSFGGVSCFLKVYFKAVLKVNKITKIKTYAVDKKDVII